MCSVDTTSKKVMFPLMQTVFLRGPAMIYLMDMVISGCENQEGAIQMLESHFLDDRANKLNYDVWTELSF